MDKKKIQRLEKIDKLLRTITPFLYGLSFLLVLLTRNFVAAMWVGGAAFNYWAWREAQKRADFWYEAFHYFLELEVNQSKKQVVLMKKIRTSNVPAAGVNPIPKKRKVVN